MSSSNLKIAIIGAGPASLTLANILQKNSIAFTIYEASTVLRDQGGTLDLHYQAGQRALREAGLWAEFEKDSRPESDIMKLIKLPSGKVLWDENGPDYHEDSEEDARPEIDRSKLMELLLKNIKPSIVWGKKLSKVVPSGETQKHDLHFADSSIEKDFDLVVGGDGAWSKVREILTPTKPSYSGISLIEVWAEKADTQHPWVTEFAGKGSTMAFGQDRVIIAQRLGDGSYRTYACLRVPESFLQDCGIDFAGDGPAATNAFVDKYFGDVGADLQRVVRESTDKLVPRTLYHLPVGFSWPSHPGVTLIGDSAHLMTPFAGVGVNAAMLDSVELAQAIKSAADGEKSLEIALAEYEKDLFPRGEKFAAKTMKGLQGHFSENGADKLHARLVEAFGQGETKKQGPPTGFGHN